MNKAKNTIPVYDLCSINPGRVHQDISAVPFAHILKIRDKLNVPHRHAYYHFMLFMKGSGTVTIDFEKFDLLPGRIYFMVPGQVHCWDISDEKDGYVVNFYEHLFSSFISTPQYLEQFPFLRGIPELSVIDLKDGHLKEVISIIEQIVNEVKEKDNFSVDQVCFHLMSLFISISRYQGLTVKKYITEQSENILYNFRKLVNQYYTEKKLPREYAAMLFVTPNHLNAICKEELGKSAGEVIRDRILLEAKRLLTSVDLSISEIAFRLNFKDNSYFTKFFKKYTGQTPEEFKRQYTESS